MSPAQTATFRAQLREISNEAGSGGEWVDHAAMIARLAEIVELLLPPEEPQRDPVAYKDYLPCLDTECGPAPKAGA